MPLSVNGVEITDEAIQKEYERLKPAYDRHVAERKVPANPDELKDWSRNSLIEQTLLGQEAAQRFPDTTGTPDVDEDATKAPRPKSPIDQLMASVVEAVPEPDDADVATEYERHKEYFKSPEQVHASHLVKHTPQGQTDQAIYLEMLNIREQLNQGADFGELVANNSDCSDRSGDLGFFPRGQMVEAFEDIVFTLEPGTYSEVFQTPFGYHIAVVHERRPEGTRPLQEVAPEIERHLHDVTRRTAIQELIAELRSKATIQDA